MLSRMILLKKARIALRQGRLDEAYGIVTDGDLREHRQGQILGEKLVGPLLSRAEKHLADGRTEDALADVERAANLGGNRPRTASLRERILAALTEKRRDAFRERAVLDSVRRHIQAGQVGAAEGRLEAVPGDVTRKMQLEREVKRLREETEAAQTRLRDHLKHGELTAALEAAADALAGSGAETATRELVLEATRRAERALDEALVAGRLERAQALAAGLEALEGAAPGEGRWREALALCENAAEAAESGDWREARVFAGRLRGLLPEAKWVKACEEKLGVVEDAIHFLRCSPLEQVSSSSGGHAAGAAEKSRKRRTPDRDLGATVSVAASAPVKKALAGGVAAAPLPRVQGAGSPAGRRVLWVNGVGSYLLLSQERVTLGRAGSSARPDVALAADIEGVHAELVRVDGDYFVVARGPVKVNGRAVERHLLADGDEVLLGKRARLKFRLPTSLSSTAVLELGTGLRVSGDVRSVLLIDEHILIGDGGECHVQAHGANGRVVLSLDGQGFRLKSPEPIAVNGEARSGEETVPLGVVVETGSLAFTMTADTMTAGGRRGERP